MSDIEKRLNALEKWRAHIEPYINRHIPLGPNREQDEEMEKRRSQAFEALTKDLLKAKEPVPVDRSKVQLTDGQPVTPDHRELKPNGQQKGYVVLSPEERAKGFVRPVRSSYRHDKCGIITTMGKSLAETYARDPKFYGGTFCCGCGTHYPVSQFTWEGTEERVGS